MKAEKSLQLLGPFFLPPEAAFPRREVAFPRREVAFPYGEGGTP